MPYHPREVGCTPHSAYDVHNKHIKKWTAKYIMYMMFKTGAHKNSLHDAQCV